MMPAMSTLPASPATKTSRLDDYDRLEVSSRAQWRRWLADNHERDRGVWLIRFKRGHARHLSYEEMIEEALCFGWIDSTMRSLDDERSMLLLSPRRKGSMWSRLNKERLVHLFADDRMENPGIIAIERAVHDGSWDILDDVEDLVVPDDLARALDGRAGARAGYEGYTRGLKKQVLWWIKSAKRDATRASRIDKTVAAAAAGRAPVG
jgi:uncharacterized protein YdeI (YjbR/CyaY-like superfamily)